MKTCESCGATVPESANICKLCFDDLTETTAPKSSNTGTLVLGALAAMSVVAAIAAPNIMTPAESGLLVHLKWMREQLDSNQLWCICWADTRSMAADGLTKGTVDRQALHDILNGIWQLNQPLKVWRSPMAARSDRT